MVHVIRKSTPIILTECWNAVVQTHAVDSFVPIKRLAIWNPIPVLGIYCYFLF